MITTLAFVIGFIVIGVAVIVAAFGGRRRESERAAGPTRRGRKAVAIFVGATVVVLGVVVPALVLVAGRDRSEKGPGGVELTAGETQGREVFRLRCGTCHTLSAANAVGRVGPNLDQLRPPPPLTLDAIEKGRARGQGQMPAQLVTGEEARNVATFIAKVAGR
ncbi:MAG TPA: cytochrome c [Solirubrobacteraceae bacterium]|nr:cytochrome c [Solirubrobacteraceae bacterium]